MVFKGCSDEQVMWGSNIDPRKVMKVGDKVTIERTEVHTWHTKFYFKEYPGMGFNSVCFDWD